MVKTKTVRFSNMNNFKKKFKKIEPKIKNKVIKFTLNFMDFNAKIKIEDNQNLKIYNDDDWFGFIKIMDIFELIIYVNNENGSEECYIIKYEDVA